MDIKKRGLSPVIATVLLIAMVLVLAIIIFLWARGFLSEQIEKFGQPVETVCDNVDFDVEFRGGQGGTLDIVNRGNVPIHNFEIKKIFKGGNSEIESLDFPLDVGESTSESIVLDSSLVQKIVIFPRVLGTVKGKKLNKAVTCIKQGKTIQIIT